MKIIKLAIISIVFFFLLFTIVSFFFPSQISVVRYVDIHANKDSIMVQVSDPKDWKNWYPGADSMELFTIASQNKGIKIDKDDAIIITAISDTTVLANYKGKSEKRGGMDWYFYPAANPGATTVQWKMDFRLGWLPWEKFSGLTLDGRYGTGMDSSLRKLKLYLEK